MSKKAYAPGRNTVPYAILVGMYFSRIHNDSLSPKGAISHTKAEIVEFSSRWTDKTIVREKEKGRIAMTAPP